MFLLSSQLPSPSHPSLESALAALQDASQLLNEDFDRGHEACNQFWQKSAESSWQTYSELFACKEPQDFFMVSSAHLKFCLEQSSLLQNTLNCIVQDAGQRYQELIKQSFNLPQASILLATPHAPTIKLTATPLELIIDRQSSIKAAPVTTELLTPPAKPSSQRKASSSVKAKGRSSTSAISKVSVAKPAIKKPSFPTVPGREPATPSKTATKNKRVAS